MKHKPNDVQEVVDDVLARICHQLERSRMERGWTQGDLAEVVGINKSTMGEFLVGKRMSVELLVRTAIALDMGWVDLLAGPVEVFMLGHRPQPGNHHRMRCSDCKRIIKRRTGPQERDDKGRPVPLLCPVCVELRELRALKPAA